MIAELDDNVEVQKKGCHVRFLPKDETKIAVWIRILEWLEADWGSKRIANELDRLGIRSPNTGRTLRDHGVAHAFPGKWNHNTVKTLAGNAIITGVKIYGRFSEGVHYRVSDDGPRPVDGHELRPDGSGKVIENDRSTWIEASAGEFSHFDRDRWERLQRKLKERSGSQAGKRKASDPNAYSLAPTSSARPDQLDVEGEVRKALTLLERVETLGTDPVAREDMPRLFNDLGVRSGLTFREGRFNGRLVRKPKGDIIAFGNRRIGRPMALRQASAVRGGS